MGNRMKNCCGSDTTQPNPRRNQKENPFDKPRGVPISEIQDDQPRGGPVFQNQDAQKSSDNKAQSIGQGVSPKPLTNPEVQTSPVQQPLPYSVVQTNSIKQLHTEVTQPSYTEAQLIQEPINKPLSALPLTGDQSPMVTETLLQRKMTGDATLKRRRSTLTQRADIINQVNEIFVKYDTDGNGTLDITEIKPFFFGVRNRHQQYPDAVFEEFFKQLDKNNDHAISKVEMFNHLWDLEYGDDCKKQVIHEEDFDQALQRNLTHKRVFEQGFEPILES